MKCTDCHREVKPVVSFDIDGTLGDHHGHFQRFAEAYLGRPVGPTRGGINFGSAQVVAFQYLYPYDVEFSDWLGIPKDTYRTIKLAYRQGGMKRSMPVFHGASALVAEAREAGAEIWLATTRPYLRLDNIDPDTRHWLERNSIHYDGLIYGEDKYEELASIVGPDRVAVVVDDLPEQTRAADVAGLPVALKVNGHSARAIKEANARREISRLTGTSTQYVIDQINTWKKENA